MEEIWMTFADAGNETQLLYLKRVWVVLIETFEEEEGLLWYTEKFAFLEY